jgi:hypothetical protein
MFQFNLRFYGHFYIQKPYSSERVFFILTLQKPKQTTMDLSIKDSLCLTQILHNHFYPFLLMELDYGNT